MKIKEFIKEFEKIPSVSGRENESAEYIKNNFGKYFDNCIISPSNSILLYKRGIGNNPEKILFDAHIDRIGFIISKIYDDGFFKCDNIGGIDVQSILSSSFIINGKTKSKCISCLKPVHLTDKNDKNKKIKIGDVLFDSGIKENCTEHYDIGDIVTFSPAFCEINDDMISSSGLDNMVSIAALLDFSIDLEAIENDIYILFSSCEETSSAGVKDILSEYDFDRAYILDAGFSYYRGMDELSSIKEGKGPSISYADTLDPYFARRIKSLAKEKGIEIQEIAEPTSTGTNATSVQIQNSGIPSAVISIPIKNMHTQNEIVRISDIKKTSELLKILCSKITEE